MLIAILLVGVGPSVALTQPLFDWARSRGTYICPSLTIRPETDENPRGIIATEDIEAGVVLITLPAMMQLGIEQALDDCGELLAGLPASLWNARLGLALCFEKRRAALSPFASYIEELPNDLTCALAPGFSGNGMSSALAAWPPTGSRVFGMRDSLRALHVRLSRRAADLDADAPSKEELFWATAIAGSRAYRVRGAPGDKERSGGNAARLLPIIDLANYGIGERANAELRNAPTDGTAGASSDELAVALYARRPITTGTEVLVDYGSGKALSNERLLLEYGFTLEDHPHDTLELPFGAILVGLAAVEDAGPGGESGTGRSAASAEKDESELDKLAARQQALLAELGDVEEAGIVFHGDGTPADETYAVALVLTARASSELQDLTIAELVRAAKTAPAAPAPTRARLALRAVVSETLDQVRAALSVELQGGDADHAHGFEAEARAYCRSRRAILERAMDQLDK